MLRDQKTRAKEVHPFDKKRGDEYDSKLMEISEYYKPIDYSGFRNHENKVQEYLELKSKEWNTNFIN